MANFLAYRILEGKFEFKDVPMKLQDEVKAILIELGYEELIK